MALSVVPVGTNRKLARTWAELPRAVYRDDPNWVPPLRSDVLRGMNRRRNPLYRYADIEHFVLFDDSVPVGRVAASVHPDYNERFAAKAGFFGFFDCHAGGGYTQHLLAAAEKWVAERGMTRIAGPYNYFSGQEMGLLVDGFTEPPAAFQTYNPPRYEEHLRACGYRPELTAGTYRIDRASAAATLAEQRGPGDELRARHGITVRTLRKRHFARDMDLVRRLLNTSFADNEDVIPYREDIFADLVRPLRWVAEDYYVRFMERGGETIGFTAVVPDVNTILRELDGRVRPRDLLRLRPLIRGMNGVVALIAGVVPGSPSGMGKIVMAELYESFLSSNAHTMFTSWVHDDNQAMRVPLIKWGMQPHRRYAIFGRELTS